MGSRELRDLRKVTGSMWQDWGWDSTVLACDPPWELGRRRSSHPGLFAFSGEGLGASGLLTILQNGGRPAVLFSWVVEIDLPYLHCSSQDPSPPPPLPSHARPSFQQGGVAAGTTAGLRPVFPGRGCGRSCLPIPGEKLLGQGSFSLT